MPFGPLGFKTLPIPGHLQNLLLPLYFWGNVSLMVKRSNPGYLLKSFYFNSSLACCCLLYIFVGAWLLDLPTIIIKGKSWRSCTQSSVKLGSRHKWNIEKYEKYHPKLWFGGLEYFYTWVRRMELTSFYSFINCYRHHSNSYPDNSIQIIEKIGT